MEPVINVCPFADAERIARAILDWPEERQWQLLEVLTPSPEYAEAQIAEHPEALAIADALAERYAATSETTVVFRTLAHNGQWAYIAFARERGDRPTPRLSISAYLIADPSLHAQARRAYRDQRPLDWPTIDLREDAEATPGYLTATQAAHELGVDVSLVRRWVREQELGQRIGRTILLSPEDMDAIRDQRRPRGRPSAS